MLTKNSKISLKGLNELSYFAYQFEKLNRYLQEHNGMILIATVKLKVRDLFDESREVSVRTKQCPITNEEGLRKALKEMRPDIEIRFQDMALYQSGLVIDKVEEIHIMYNRYNPTRAGSYIPLPNHISLKKACINIKNKDDKCFKYAVECGYYKVYEKNHPENFYHYKKLNSTLNFENVNFPADIVDIDTFEENNQSISISVWTLDEKGYTIIYRKLKNKNAECHIDLLRIDEEEQSHYVFLGHKNY